MSVPRAIPADRLAFLLGPLAGAALAIWLGQSTSWDLRNYHWYNPYVLLTGRLGFDAAVAHHATFYNPLIDLPLWLVGHAVPGWAAAAFLGLVQGLNGTFLYLIARDALAPDLAARRAVAIALAVLGMTGGYAVVLTGTTYYDNVVSVPVLAGLWLLVKHREALATRTWPALVAGLLVGIAVGLKLPTAPFGLAILVAAALVPLTFARRAVVIFACGAAAFAGLMITTGWWFFVLWQETGNPLFPYFNDLIGSPLIADGSYRDTRFLPQTWGDALILPFRFAENWRVSSDWPVNDWRIAFAYVAVPLGVLALIRPARRPLVAAGAAPMLFGFAIAAYLSWLMVFAIYRYITPLEMLAPLLIVAAFGLIPLPRLVTAAAATAALVAAVAMTTLYKGPRADFADRFVLADPPPIARPDATLALMTGVEPMGFAVPFFPPQIAFLRIDGFLVTPAGRTGYLQGMIDRIDAHLAAGGDLFTLYAPAETGRGDKALADLGLKRTDECAKLTSTIAPPLNWCRVERP